MKNDLNAEFNLLNIFFTRSHPFADVLYIQNKKMQKRMQPMMNRFNIIIIFQQLKTISQITTVNKGIMK